MLIHGLERTCNFVNEIPQEEMTVTQITDTAGDGCNCRKSTCNVYHLFTTVAPHYNEDPIITNNI